MHKIEQVDIPSAEQIKGLREQIGTQAACANMAQVNIKTWQDWEAGRRNPTPASWGMFLLAIDQHPDFFLNRK